jgi:hypothetical protein
MHGLLTVSVHILRNVAEMFHRTIGKEMFNDKKGIIDLHYGK